VKTRPLEPFGAIIELPAGADFATLDVDRLRRDVLRHRVLIIRGLADWTRDEMVGVARRLGPIQGWSFGAIHELKVDPEADNYLYTTHAVPLHWDGAFADEQPDLLLFRCLEADPDAGGETVFADTVALCADASRAELDAWDRRIRLSTEHRAHYGGAVLRRVLQRHPVTGEQVIRFAEPVDDLNPLKVVMGDQVAPLSARCRDPRWLLEHAWQPGDCLLADNRALLHGRNAFRPGTARRLWRVNILGTRPRWQALRDAIAVRRPEFLICEISLVLMAAALAAPSLTALATPAWAEMLAVILLLVGVGDLVNCWADRDADRVWKTHLSEAVGRLGGRRMAALIGASVVAAILLSVHLWWAWGAPFWVPAGTLAGLLAGAAYSAGPLPLKDSGLGQIVGYTILLGVGPVILATGAFWEWPTPRAVGVAFAYGVLQSGVMLLNCAEDLIEDRRAGTRTAAAALGTGRVMPAAAALVAIGACLLLVFVQPGWLGSALFSAVMAAVTFWLIHVAFRLRGVPIEIWDSRVKKAGRWAPHLLGVVGWATFGVIVAARVGM